MANARKRTGIYRLLAVYFRGRTLTAWGGLPGKDANRLITFFNGLVEYLIENEQGMESLKYVLTRSSGPTFQQSRMTAFLYR